MGNQLVSIDVLRQISSSSSKLYHGLVSSDLNPRDHQNYTSYVRISRDEIFQPLENIDNSNATMIYIKLLSSIIDAYIDKSTSLLDRACHAWTSVFLFRLWLLWIDKMGKKKLDNLFVALTRHATGYDHLPKKQHSTIFSNATSDPFNRTERTLFNLLTTFGDRRSIIRRSTLY